MKDLKVSRRTFLASSTAGSLALASGIGAKTFALSEKLKIGVIGCGWYGMVDLKAAFKVGGVECVALCDVDSEHLAKSADSVEEMQEIRPKLFKDYRKLLDVKGLQAVIIATPPQWHALQFIDAINKGLNIYCEKPLAFDIREGQAMLKAAEKSDQIVQIGFQRRQSKTIAAARDYIQNGNIGKVVQVDVQIHYNAGMKDATPQDPPASLDWDTWCGPASKLPYSPQIGHMSWRLEKEYGNGHLVDWGIHLIDATRWILDEKMPKAIQAAGGIYVHKNHITTPDTLTVHFEFESCPVVWRHRLWGAQEYDSNTKNGIFFYGEKGTLFVTDSRWEIIPPKNGEHQVFEEKTDMGPLHMAEFLNAVKTRKQPTCLPLDAFYSTSTVQLGMIAYHAKEEINWDIKSMNILGDPLAAKLLKREYRVPYKHPFENM